MFRDLPHPYGSPIERDFAWQSMKYISSNIVLDNQVPIASQHGDFRIDFVLSDGNRRIALECDGRDFHEPFRDELRDAIYAFACKHPGFGLDELIGFRFADAGKEGD